jgi:hypothetical protein
MLKSIVTAAVVALGIAGTAQAAQEGLVNVKVGNIAALNDLNIANGTSVSVPIGIAAQVCGVDANVLAKQGQGAIPDCTVNQEQSTESFVNYVKNHSTTQ